jgi:DeoR/GlpR family transcriptional regulator of sugar metabolism
MVKDMFMEERLEGILEIIKREGTVKVKDLSERFDVSEGMIRKDLCNLEKKSHIKRTYGGAILERNIIHNENTTSRVIRNLEEKEKIARLAIEEIKEKDLIFLDISSTNYIMASLLSSFNKNITVVTNMNRIAMEFDSNKNIDVILIGGNYNKKLGGTVGSFANEEIKKFRFDKAFIGSGGVNVEGNFLSNFNLDESLTKSTILNCSKKNYLLIGKDKFYNDGSYKFGILEDINCIITEENTNEKIRKILNNKGIELIFNK